ncbi:hypothetical protein EMCRGX_G018425 [Ephydatia muelleri]
MPWTLKQKCGLVTLCAGGVGHYHKDISNNYVASLSWDYVDNDNDPYPGVVYGLVESHGTSCSGAVAIVKSNDVCGVGVAYNAGIADYISDQSVGEFGLHRHTGGIFSLPLGRGGKGSIFVWASGNGGLYSDCCAADGYVTNVYTIPIGSASIDGTAVYYDEKCSAKMAVVFMYSSTGSVQVVLMLKMFYKVPKASLTQLVVLWEIRMDLLPREFCFLSASFKRHTFHEFVIHISFSFSNSKCFQIPESFQLQIKPLQIMVLFNTWEEMRFVQDTWTGEPCTGPDNTQPSLVSSAVGPLTPRLTLPVTNVQYRSDPMRMLISRP